MIDYIIVDDEMASHEIIKDFAKSISLLSFQKSCYNAFEALDYVNQNEVDLIFLDMKMPKLSGFEFLKTLSKPPRVIVTTAHKEFALEGFDLNIDDYLLKPFSLTRFITAVNKSAVHINDEKSSENSKSIFLKDNKKHHQIMLNDILFCEAYGNYIKVHLIDKMIVIHQTFKSLDSTLPQDQFIKVHKSYIVAKRSIRLVESSIVHIGEHRIPVGKKFIGNIKALLG